MIYCVEDDDSIRELVVYTLESTGFHARGFEDGKMFKTALAEELPELVLLDIMLPGEDGMEILKGLKTSAKTRDIPVIMLSARGEEYDRIHGFELGVDDYVVKPFSPKELMMRIHVVINRHKSKTESEEKRDLYEREGLRIDFTARQVTVDGKEVSMTPREYDLLFFLVRNRGIALSREKLITGVWGYDYYGDDRTLDTHIKLLRSSLGPYRKFLVTLRGVGYRVEA